jgi:hypothetical protein
MRQTMHISSYSTMRFFCWTFSRLLQLTARLCCGLLTFVQASARSNHVRVLLYTKAFVDRLPTPLSRILQDCFTSTLTQLFFYSR